jgi:replication factor C subunit 3/5
MDYQPELSTRLTKMAAAGNQPHMLFVGPNGAGKSTRVHALLRELYGPGVDAIKVETKSVAPNPSSPSTTVDIQVVVSNYHLQLTPSDVGNKDRAVVMQLIKEVAAHPPLGSHGFKVVVIDEAGTLTGQAQAALRRTMEKYMKTCRIILLTDSASKIIPPLRSRCLAVRVGAPTTEQVQAVLQKVAMKENLKLENELAIRIAEKANRDVRRAVLILESVHAQGNQFTKDMVLPIEGWEMAVDKIAKKILQEQSPKCVMEVRSMLYELMAACLPSDFILKELMNKLLADQRDEKVKQGTIAAAAHFESTMRQGSKDIFHLEAFVLRFMADFKAASQGRR